MFLATNGHQSKGLASQTVHRDTAVRSNFSKRPRFAPGKCKREADGGGHSTGGQPNRRTNDTISEAFSFEVIETGAGQLAETIRGTTTGRSAFRLDMDRASPSIPDRVSVLGNGGRTMCDYSLHAVPSRPAEVGECLVCTCFPGSSTFGFASPKELGVAVCLLPGTELAFEKNVRYHRGWFRSLAVNFNVAKFCKLDPEAPQKHHDALAFPDGSTVLVNTLVRGQQPECIRN